MSIAARRVDRSDPPRRSRPSIAPGVTLHDFLPPARAITAAPPSPIRMALLLAICALFTIAIIWACFGRLDIYAVARGRIQPIGRSKLVQPVDGGRVLAVHVREGDRVAAGALLVEIDPTATRADQTALSMHVIDLDAEIARRQVELAAAAGSRDVIPSIPFPAATPALVAARERSVLAAELGSLYSNLALLRARAGQNAAQSQALKATLAAQEQVRRTLDERVAMNSTLFEQGWNTKSRVIDAREDRDRQVGTLVSEHGAELEATAAARAARDAIAQSRAQFLADNAKTLDQIEQEREKAAQDLLRATDKLAHTKIYAPIGGTVQQLAVTTVGQVVGSGQQLMTIVPNGPALEIEALVENQDIGFVREGQPATVKVDTFPFTRYGTLSAHVTRVSRDAVTDTEALGQEDTETKPVQAQNDAAAPTPKTGQLVYPVHVEIHGSGMPIDGRIVPLSAGENVTVEIRTGRRRVIDYLLSPLTETASSAAHER